MIRDEFIEKMNALGFGVSSEFNNNDELVETVVTSYEDEADEDGEKLAIVGEIMVKDCCYCWSTLNKISIEKMLVFTKEVQKYIATPIDERNIQDSVWG